MDSFVSCGIPYLDRTLGGFSLGDNIVWALEPGTYFDFFLEAFVAKREPQKFKVVYISFDFPPNKILSRYQKLFRKDEFVLVDAFTFGKGKGDEYFQSFYRHLTPKTKSSRVSCIKNPADPTEFINTMSTIQDELQHGPSCKYIFGSLTGMQELWGERDALHFFTYTCPKLFELKALAYWPLVKDAHSKACLATISYITQIVLELSFQEENACAVRILKMEGRPSRLLNVAHYYTVQDNTITFFDSAGDSALAKNDAVNIAKTAVAPGTTPEWGASREPLRVGTRIRDYRAEKKLSQAELARILNITPSALSQIENNQSLPSLTLFVEIARFFGKPLDSFLPTEQAPVRTPRTRE